MKDSILLNRLDSLSINIAQIKKHINTDTGITAEKIFVLLGAILVAYLGFLWTKNKEYRAKRSDIAGEIHLQIFDFKIALFHYVRHNIYFMANKRIVEIITNEEWRYTSDVEGRETYDPNIYIEGRENSYKWMNEQKEKLFQARRILSKHLGQYKFYLTKETREEFNIAVQRFNALRLLDYSFADLNNMTDIDLRIKELLEKSVLDIRHKYKTEIDLIETFLEANID